MWLLVLYPTIFDSGLVLWADGALGGLVGTICLCRLTQHSFKGTLLLLSLALAPPWASSLSRP